MAESTAIVIPIYLSPVSSEAEAGEASVIDTPAQAGAAPPGSELPESNKSDKAQKKAAKNAESNKNAAKALAKQIGKKVAMTALSNYGNVTGNTVEQQNIQTAVGEALSISAAVSLGPAGVALYVVDKGIQAYNYISDLKQSSARSSFAQKRVYGSEKRS